MSRRTGNPAFRGVSCSFLQAGLPQRISARPAPPRRRVRSAGRSYAGAYVDEDPVLGSSAVHLQLTPGGVGSAVNWVIRASGTTASGLRIELGDAAAPVVR